MEDGAREAAQQVFAEGERHQLVGREGRLAQLEAVEQAVEDAAVALLAGDREARELERVEVAVDRALVALELGGEVVEAGAVAAAREELDQPPLPRELIASHPVGELAVAARSRACCLYVAVFAIIFLAPAPARFTCL